MRRLFAVTCLVLGLIAGPALSHEEKLAGAEWVLEGAAGGKGPLLRFEAGRVAGSGGCNRFGGSYKLDGDSLSFSPLAATRMACPGDAMKTEQEFFDMLGKVKAMKLEGAQLELLDGEGKVLGRFSRQVAE